jgi:hypothetical protein
VALFTKGYLNNMALPRGETKAAQEMEQGARVHTNTPLYAEGQANELREPGYDFLSLTDQEYTDYGINKETEVHCWIRNPDIWMRHEMMDRASTFRQEDKQRRRRIVLVDGQPVMNGDLILATKSRAEVEESEARQRRETDAFLEQIETGDVPGVPRYRPGSTDEMRAQAEAQYAENVAQGLIGPTSGMAWEAVMQQKGVEAFEREAAFYRNGGRHVDVPEGGAGEALEARRESAQTARGAGGKFISIPNNVRPKNFAGTKK